MPAAAPASSKLFPLSKDAISSTTTDEGAIVEMTTAPRQIFHPDGFVKTVPVTRWRRGPMHPDDASVLMRIALAHGTAPKGWTPILPAPEEKDPFWPDSTNEPVERADHGQGDFGDLFRL